MAELFVELLEQSQKGNFDGMKLGAGIAPRSHDDIHADWQLLALSTKRFANAAFPIISRGCGANLLGNTQAQATKWSGCTDSMYDECFIGCHQSMIEDCRKRVATAES